VDDLQWADQSTLDVLTCLLAGLDTQRLLLVCTYRDPGVGASHPLRRWLADARRMPGVDELRLERLDRRSAAQQVENALCTAAAEHLSSAIYERTDGNPYLTHLLLRELEPDTYTLPDRLPTALADALRALTAALDASARDVCALIAVGGEPVAPSMLAAVCAEAGLAVELDTALRQAADAAVLERRSAGEWWFVHPLLAELLDRDLQLQSRRKFHVAWIHVVEKAVELTPMAQAAALAQHYHAVGDLRAAYDWSVRAAEAARALGAHPEALRAYQRALGLWPQLPATAANDRLELLRHAQRAAYGDGDWAAELDLVEEQLAVLERESAPVLVARLLARQQELRFRTGRAPRDVDVLRKACDLAVGDPEQHAHLLAMLAKAELWDRDPVGVRHAAEAYERARTSGSAGALARALVSRAFASAETGRIDAASGTRGRTGPLATGRHTNDVRQRAYRGGPCGGGPGRHTADSPGCTQGCTRRRLAAAAVPRRTCGRGSNPGWP
jgi:predicted ATPase